MAFAEVVPQSMIIGQQEFIDNIRKNSKKTHQQEIYDVNSWGSDPSVQDEKTNEITYEDQPDVLGWGACFATSDADSISNGEEWRIVPYASETGSFPESAWQKPLDCWGNGSVFSESEETQYAAKQGDADFDILAKQQQNWCWSCLKVNSPELDTIWFVIPQDLLKELAKTMYAGEVSLNVDTALMRDIIAELTNVIGGRLMLLLEELCGKFTLEVPVTGVGLPDFDDKNIVNETLICKVLVDGAYPVLSTMRFRDDISLQNQSDNHEQNMIQK